MKRKLTLDQPVSYEIRVPGHLDAGWTAWEGRMKVTHAAGDDDSPVTILCGTVDQAALQGLLRRIYALGLPLISVTWIEGD